MKLLESWTNYLLYLQVHLFHTFVELLSCNTIAVKCYKKYVASTVYLLVFFVHIGFTQEQINRLIVLELQMFAP